MCRRNLLRRTSPEHRFNAKTGRSQADGDFIGLIDGDELPVSKWLLKLFKTCVELKVSGVLGPVLAVPFRAEFGTGGEDQDFFRRAIERGEEFVLCDEAPVFEWVPPSRWNRQFMLSRALLRGKNSLRHRQNRLSNILRSIIALPIYFLALPVLFVLRYDYFYEVSHKTC